MILQSDPENVKKTLQELNSDGEVEHSVKGNDSSSESEN